MLLQNDLGPVDSLQGFLGRVEEFCTTWYPVSRGEPWFRGSAHRLQPGAVWGGLTGSDELSAYHEFVARVSGTMMAREPVDEWEWYFLLQHYGMATRLLDWTTNPFVAAYFALRSASDGPTPSGLVHVWMLDPTKLNLACVGFEEVFAPGGELTRHWLPSMLKPGSPHPFGFDGNEDITNTYPLAIYPKRRNPRILAQSGTFTIHGTDTTAVDEVMGRLAEHDRKIARIDVNVVPEKAQEILYQLARIGFSESTLFPEPASLAKEIRDKYTQR
jgi:hypothetical protein